MAEGDTPPQGGKTDTGGGGGKTASATTKGYFLSKSSSVDELIVGKGTEDEKHVFKQYDWTDPVDLTDDEVKDARAVGVSLTEAKD